MNVLEHDRMWNWEIESVCFQWRIDTRCMSCTSLVSEAPCLPDETNRGRLGAIVTSTQVLTMTLHSSGTFVGEAFLFAH